MNRVLRRFAPSAIGDEEAPGDPGVSPALLPDHLLHPRARVTERLAGAVSPMVAERGGKKCRKSRPGCRSLVERP